jgi:RNA polymerase sigma-70 factor (ECF subfamily)
MDLSPSNGESIDVPNPTDERELVRRLGESDASALKRLLRLYWENIVRYALHIVNSQDIAEDVAQEAFVRLWSHRERWQGMHSVRPVLYRIARNLALNEVRRLSTFQRWLQRIRADASATDTAPGPYQDTISAELDAVMRRAVDALPERRREIFILVRFHRLSHHEAGEVLGITAQAVSNQMSRALAELHAALDPHLEGDSAQHIDFPVARTITRSASLFS